MTMLVALYEVYTGDLSDALSRLQWYAGVSGVGYMPPGEAVSWQTDQPIVSTMSEPFTAATFVTTALAYTGQYDERVYPTNANASAYATINETTTPSNDWPQWRGIPFYDGNPAGSASGSKMTSIARVYAANDSTNLYLRVDNMSGALSAYNTQPEFAILIYAQDFDHSGSLHSTTTGYFGGTLDHPMNYLFARLERQQHVLDVQRQLERRVDVGLQLEHSGSSVGHGHGPYRAGGTVIGHGQFQPRPPATGRTWTSIWSSTIRALGRTTTSWASTTRSPVQVKPGSRGARLATRSRA